MTTYGRALCDAYHGGLVPPPATVDWGRRIDGKVRFSCDQHARGLKGWRDTNRIVGAPLVEVPA